MAYLEELLPEFRNGAKIKQKCWENGRFHTIWGRGGIYYNMEGFKADDWEIYQEPIDWDYIINNKCPCWFWDGDEDNNLTPGLLIYFHDNEPNGFRDHKGVRWNHCRPVRRDEVTFYEERKDKI